MSRAPEAAGQGGREDVRQLRRPWTGTMLVALGYLVVSLAYHHDVLPRLTSATIGRVTSDSYLFVWWLEWFPWSLQHGLNPLFTTYQNHPVGVNAMWNTTAPVLAMLFAPVTLTAGPVAAYNVAMVLGPVASGCALVLALRPYVARLWPRAVAGLLYGFGPFAAAHLSVGHLNIAWALLPPVLLWAVHVLVVRPTAAPVRAGALLGVAFAVQTVLYTQTVALGALVLVAVAAVLATRSPGAVAARVPHLARAALACVVTYAVLCAYPLYQLLAGAARPHGRIRDPAITGADAANVVVPTELTALRYGTGAAAGQLRSHPGEQGGYIGLAVLAVLVVALVVTRNKVARTAVAVGTVLFVLSLGRSLVVLGRDTGVPLPWVPLERIPLVGQAEPVRLQIFVALCVAVVAAVWLDHLASRPPGPARTGALVLTLAALATWVPADEQVATPTTVPVFFTRSAAEQLGPDDVVDTAPRLSGAWIAGTDPLLWQAVSGMAYRTIGGYFIGSDDRHDLLLEAPISWFEGGVDVIGRGGTPPPADAATAAADLRARGVTVVIVTERIPELRGVLDWARRVTGSPGRRVDDVWLFRVAT